MLRLHGACFFQKWLLVLKGEDWLGAHATLSVVPGSVRGVALICEVDEILKVVSFRRQTIFMSHGLDSIYNCEAGWWGKYRRDGYDLSEWLREQGESLQLTEFKLFFLFLNTLSGGKLFKRPNHCLVCLQVFTVGLIPAAPLFSTEVHRNTKLSWLPVASSVSCCTSFTVCCGLVWMWANRKKVIFTFHWRLFDHFQSYLAGRPLVSAGSLQTLEKTK